ncbi:MAG TPA: DinB family protein [Thermomicrobiales bacterium]|jgi:hypothetical protein|nr:DinB family protein [Thermomicrobiales bacterium]
MTAPQSPLPPLDAHRLLAWAPGVLTATPTVLQALVGNVESTLLRQRPLPGQWSPVEVIHHLLDCERLILPVRIRALLGGAREIPAIDENAIKWDLGRDPAALVSEFGDLRLDTLSLIARLSPDDLDLGATHSEYGPVTIGQMLAYFPAHDLTHLQQIERALLQPFVPLAGPWTPNIADMVMR